ncbi:MAG TPA: DUF1080 domain-containing protein [Planctomycetota bacterium]|nr:DUF1080 domain-containing protein [Planctomycetota bacterium]
MRLVAVLALLAAGCAGGSMSPMQADPGGFVPLFNGKDLSGWVNVNCAPATWTVKDGEILCTGKPTGILRTDRQYENYVLELEWNHQSQKGNAGLFVNSAGLPICGQPFTKSIEVQVMLMEKPHPEGHYTGQGDVFSIQGATFVPDRPHPKGWERCLPSKHRTKPAGEWNHYKVVCTDGSVKLHVNGQEVSGGTKCNPRKGYICLESEGSPIKFRNLRIKELPSSNPPAAEIADTDLGFLPLYTGVDLAGWKTDPANDGHWTPRNWVLDYDGKGGDLWSQKEYGDFVLVADWRFTRKPVEKENPVIDADGNDTGQKQKTMDAGDSGIYLRGNSKSQVNLWCWPAGSGEVYGYRTDKAMSPEVRKGVTPKANADNKPGQWNRIVITMKGDRLTVASNGKTVIVNAQLPGVPARGPIALQNHGDPIQFANLYIKELP